MHSLAYGLSLSIHLHILHVAKVHISPDWSISFQLCLLVQTKDPHGDLQKLIKYNSFKRCIYFWHSNALGWHPIQTPVLIKPFWLFPFYPFSLTPADGQLLGYVLFIPFLPHPDDQKLQKKKSWWDCVYGCIKILSAVSPMQASTEAY